MLFPTIDFFVFFVVTFTATWALNPFNEVKKIVLLTASYFFYAQWSFGFLFLLAGGSFWNFAIGYAIGRLRGNSLERSMLYIGIFGNLTFLGYFKYYNFISLQIYNAFASFGFKVDFGSNELALPIAISFLTFHGISYIVDVHREKTKASNSVVNVMLYMAFFPHLVAGPIVRAAEFMPQLDTPRDPASINMGQSMLLIMGGLFKKVIIAGHISLFLVDPVFMAPNSCSSLDLVAAAVGYAVVIYCDFSGYTDIAIGIANLLGYKFPANFAQPYRAISLQEFWRRWHITLSTWLKDYLYIPLGGSRWGTFATCRNLIVTMLLGGIWHGAGAQFVIWGAMHGVALAAGRFVRLHRGAAPQGWMGVLLGWAATFTFVTFAWIFFRATSIDLALDFIWGIGLSDVAGTRLTPFTLGLIALGMTLHFMPQSLYDYMTSWLETLSGIRQALTFALVVWCIAVIAPPGIPPFIYFQF